MCYHYALFSAVYVNVSNSMERVPLIILKSCGQVTNQNLCVIVKKGMRRRQRQHHDASSVAAVLAEKAKQSYVELRSVALSIVELSIETSS